MSEKERDTIMRVFLLNIKVDELTEEECQRAMSDEFAYLDSDDDDEYYDEFEKRFGDWEAAEWEKDDEEGK